MLGIWIPDPRDIATSAATFAMLMARGALERADAAISDWLDRTSRALHGRPPPAWYVEACRAAASRRLRQVARIAADLSGNTGEPTVERAVERVFILVGAIEEQLDVIDRERVRVSAMEPSS